MSWAIRANEFFCHFVVTHPEGARRAHETGAREYPSENAGEPMPFRKVKSLQPEFSVQAPNAFPVRRGTPRREMKQSPDESSIIRSTIAVPISGR